VTAGRHDHAEHGAVGELARVFLKLGILGFGGPAAHIAMMRDEVVERRGWLGDQEFLDLMGATNLIPGPNSTEMAIHVGRLRAGWVGLLVAGACFIAPAAAIVLVLAWVYVRYGATPQGEALLYGVKPVVIAVVVQAVWMLLRTAVKDGITAAAGAGALVLYALGAGEIPVLVGGGVAVLVFRHWRRMRGTSHGFIPMGAVLGGAAGLPGLAGLFASFLKIGAVLYGSGYVLLAFLDSEFVRPGLLTQAQVVDAVAIGQFTPGPVLTAATFIGYVLNGLPGAAVATAGIFLPSFAFVAATGPLIPRLRRSAALSSALDGVNAAALALMVGVSLELGRAAVVDALTAALSIGALVGLVVFKANSAWLILGGAAVGLLARFALA
jgi:chromate transporter